MAQMALMAAAGAGMSGMVRIRSTGTTHARPRLAGGMGRGANRTGHQHIRYALKILSMKMLQNYAAKSRLSRKAMKKLRQKPSHSAQDRAGGGFLVQNDLRYGSGGITRQIASDGRVVGWTWERRDFSDHPAVLASKARRGRDAG